MPITFGDILFSLVLTIVFYCTVPVSVAFLRKKPITQKAYKRLVIINCVVVALAISALNSASGAGVSNGMPALLWGYISYTFGLKQLRKKNLLADDADNNLAAAVPPSSDYGPVDPEDYFTEDDLPQLQNAQPVTQEPQAAESDAPVVDEKESPPRKKLNFLVLAFAISVLALVGSVAYIIYQSNQLKDANDKLALLNKNYDILQDRYESTFEEKRKLETEYELEIIRLERKLNFYNDSVVFVLDDGTNIYHRYMCPHWPSGSYSYWAYNREAAISRGYSKCSYYDSGLVKS